MNSPYVTPQMLVDAPLGIAWNTIPNYNSTPDAQLAEQTNIANRATSMVDAYCNQPLRGTIDVEKIIGPDYRLTIPSDGVPHVVLARWPVLSVSGVRWSPASAFPRAWTSFPDGYWDLEESVMPVAGSLAVGSSATGASGIYLAPGYIGSRRRSNVVEVTYTNGWPHATLTTGSNTSAPSLAVDDCTGFAGCLATIFDGASTETVFVNSASATFGPGTLTLSANPLHTHASGVIVTTLPQVVQSATMLFAAHIALTRGATALTVGSLPGSEEHENSYDYATEAEVLLEPFKRVI